ncbi:MAG: hypothetical protein HDR12_03545 [Lachnospiraceae bacterium]|nr:hypothetical protein [Lachnospiraceae bacterium]
MKSKRFLKKVIAALCVIALIGVPVNVNAAVIKDVVGTWSGSGQVFIFDENGNADHYWNGNYINTRPYAIQSGTITLKYDSGSTETVSYDVWRGGEIGATDAMIYKITGSGSMLAWNIYKKDGNGDWYTYGAFNLTKVTQSNTNSGNTNPSKCAHNYEWVTTTEPTETSDGVDSYRCMYCGDVQGSQPISKYVVVRNNLLADIKNAKAGTTIIYNNKELLCYQQCVLDALKEKGNVSLRTDFTYKGVKYSFTIPAGSDYSNLEPAGFYGFMYLLGAFGGTIVE